jgi:hypothetical protein
MSSSSTSGARLPDQLDDVLGALRVGDDLDVLLHLQNGPQAPRGKSVWSSTITIRRFGLVRLIMRTSSDLLRSGRSRVQRDDDRDLHTAAGWDNT